MCALDLLEENARLGVSWCLRPSFAQKVLLCTTIPRQLCSTVHSSSAVVAAGRHSTPPDIITRNFDWLCGAFSYTTQLPEYVILSLLDFTPLSRWFEPLCEAVNFPVTLDGSWRLHMTPAILLHERNKLFALIRRSGEPRSYHPYDSKQGSLFSLCAPQMLLLDF